MKIIMSSIKWKKKKKCNESSNEEWNIEEKRKRRKQCEKQKPITSNLKISAIMKMAISINMAWQYQSNNEICERNNNNVK